MYQAAIVKGGDTRVAFSIVGIFRVCSINVRLDGTFLAAWVIVQLNVVGFDKVAYDVFGRMPVGKAPIRHKAGAVPSTAQAQGDLFVFVVASYFGRLGCDIFG